jgi:hypothetical protein
MHDTALRKPVVLPITNVYSVAGLLVLIYLTTSVFLSLLWNPNPAIEYLYLLMIVQMVPIVIAFTRRHFTYLAFIMVFHIFHLSLPKWFLFRENKNILDTYPALVQAIQEQTFCTIIIILVYYAARVFVFGSAARERFQLLTLSRSQVIPLSCYVLFVPLFLHKLPAWFLSIHFLLLSADIVLLFTSSSPNNQYLIGFTKIAATLGAFNYFLNTGMMTLLGALVYLGALISCLKKRFGLVALIALLVVVLSAIQTVKGTYRNLIRENPGLHVGERITVLYELLSLKYFDDEETPDDDGDEENKDDDIGTNLISGFMRAGDDSLERVLAATPGRVPFWNGETYLSIPYMFIPRAFWPEKPSRHFWNKYGRSYGVLSADDFDTSVGVSYLAEAYMNFGYPGMYLLAVVIGLFFVAVERGSFYIMGGGYFYFPYIVMLMPLLAPGTDLGSMLNSFWVVLMVLLFSRPLLLHLARRDDYS